MARRLPAAKQKVVGSNLYISVFMLTNIGEITHFDCRPTK